VSGLGAVLILALALRVTGFTWGYPYILHGDENNTVDLGRQLLGSFVNEGSLNPKDSSYGALPLYLLALCAAVADYLWAWFGSLLPPVSNFTLTVYLGRLLSVCESVATVWLTAELGRRLFGRRVGLLSAVLLAVSLLSVREAHFATVDTLLVALIALALVLGERLACRGAWQDYLTMGVVISLAASTKLVALLLGVPLFVAHCWGQWRSAQGQGELATAKQLLGGLRIILLGNRLPRFIVSGIVIVTCWLALNPYAFLNPADYFALDNNGSLLTQWLVVHGEAPVLYTLQYTDTWPYLYVLTNWLRWGMGLPLELLALAGVGYACWQIFCSLFPLTGTSLQGTNTWEGIVFGNVYVLSWFFIYWLTVGAWHAKFIRYGLPLIPVLCLLAAQLLAALWQGTSRGRRVLGVALTLGVVGSSFAYTLGFLQIYRSPDTRHTAIDWLQRHVPVGSSILVEKDSHLFFHRAKKFYRLEGYTWQVWNPYEIDGVKSEEIRFQAPAASEAQVRAHLDHLLTTDYVVLGDSWHERFSLAAARFPIQADFYRRLFGGQAGYRLVQTFRMYPQLGPFVWRDDTAESTFRMFDHPTIYVFVKESIADRHGASEVRAENSSWR